MTSPDEGALVDAIYEAALQPGQWPTALAAVFDAVGGACGTLTRQSILDARGASIDVRLDPERTPAYWTHFHAVDPLARVEDPQSYLSAWRPKILTDEDWMPREALLASEYYNDYLRPLDIDAYMFIRLARRDAEMAVVGVGRPRRRGPFEARDLEAAGRLQPHLIRAYALGERLQDAAAPDVSGAGAVFVTDAGGRLRRANLAAERMLSAGDRLTCRGGRLTAVCPAAAPRLAALLVRATHEVPEARGGGVVGVASEGRRPVAVTVAPYVPSGSAIYPRERLALICATDLASELDAPGETLAALYGLTPAETRVAAELARGASQQEIADRLSLSFFTVRGHLANVFAKTGTRRQAELVGLITRLAATTPG